MYERMAGLAPDPEHPGYKHFFIQPMPGGPLTSARATLETPYGLARSAWEQKGQVLHMEAVIPPNTTATVVFPRGTTTSISVNGTPLHDIGREVPVGVTDAGLTTAVLPAGTYRFAVR
jgi:alpha-L-rhamnosidase